MDTSNKSVLRISCKKDVQDLAKDLSRNFLIKLSRARERLATSLGYNSFNHCLSEFTTPYRKPPLFFYSKDVAKILDEVLLKEHQIKSASSQALIDSYSVPITELYEFCSFEHFVTFSLIISNQSLPLMHTASKVHDSYENAALLNTALKNYLCNGVISDVLKYEMDKRLKLCRDAKAHNSYWMYSSGNSRYEKRIVLEKFKKAVDECCSPVVWHIYSSLMVHKNDEIILGESFSYLFNDLNDCLVERGRGDTFIGDVFAPLKEASQEYIEFDSWVFDYRGSLSKINPKYEFKKRNEISILSPYLGHSFSDETRNFLPESLGFSDESSLILSRNNDSDTSCGMYRTPSVLTEGVYGHEESINFSILPIVKMGSPLGKKSLSDIHDRLSLMLKEDLLKNNVLGLTDFSELYNKEDIVLSFADGYTEFKIGKLMGNWLKNNPEYGFDFSVPFFNSYLRITKDDVYRPLGFDSMIINSVLESEEAGYSFDEHGMSEVTLMKDLVKGVSKGLGEHRHVLGCYQDNLIKERSYIPSEGMYFTEYDFPTRPEFEVFPNCFFYVSGVDEFLSRLPLSSCHNVYIITYDNDEMSNVGFYIIGYDSASKCLFNVVYYDDELTLLNGSMPTDEDFCKMIEKIGRKISGVVKESLIEGFSISYDKVSHSLYDVTNESSMMDERFFKELC